MINVIEQRIKIAHREEKILLQQIEERNLIDASNVVHITGVAVYPHREQLIGDIDGVNTDYRTTYEFRNNLTFVFKNGIIQNLGNDYSEIDNSVIRFTEPPKSDGMIDDLHIIYYKN